MKPIVLLMILGLSVIKINAMNRTPSLTFKSIKQTSENGELTKTLKIKIMSNPNDHINGDTLTLKGRIVKEAMENKKGQKLEGVQDLYFSTSSGSFFIKLGGGNYLRSDLEKLELKEITIKCVKKFGNIDIDSEDPSYAQTRVGEYILILEIIN